MGAILTFSAAILFSGCTDVIDNPVTPTEPSVDPVTQEKYENDDLMDRTVKPGDSFWQFALGTWLKSHDEEDAGLQGNLINTHSSLLSYAFMESSDPLVQKLLDEADNLGTEDYMNQLFSIMFDLDIAGDSDTPPSRKQLIELLAKMVDSGYSPLVRRTINTDDGVFVRVLTSGENSAKVVGALQSGDDPVEAIKEILSMVSSFSDDPEEDDEDLDVLAQKILEIEETVGMAHNDQYADDLRLRQIATPKRDQRASQFRARRRAADGLTVEDICQALGVTDDYSVVDEQLEPIFTLLLEEDVETLASYLVFYIASQYYDLMPIDWSEYGDIFGMGSGYMNLGNGVKESLYTLLSTKAPELISRVDYMVMKDNIDIEGCRTLMEQMRTLMDGRIAANDWMSDATKGAAREKLAASARRAAWCLVRTHWRESPRECAATAPATPATDDGTGGKARRQPRLGLRHAVHDTRHVQRDVCTVPQPIVHSTCVPLRRYLPQGQRAYALRHGYGLRPRDVPRLRC